MRSRKAPDDGLCLQPPLQALGPRLPHLLGHIDDEPARPSAEVLDCLAHLDFDWSLCLCRATSAEMWARIRQAFSCVCLQISCIQTTAVCWSQHLQATDDCHCLADNVREPLLAAAAWICQTDLASWLVPETGADMHTGDTFKSSGLYLSFLECAPICLPTPC